MNMLEVDPKLFITCRLCLDEMGQYQIVPTVQMQIKYCFDIEVDPFDGLPQLLCKKCESILSQYAGIKQIYQEKQSSLQSKLKSKDVTNIVQQQQQQDTVSSTQQAEIDNNTNGVESNELTTNKMTINSTSSVDKFIKSDGQKVKPKIPFSWKDDYIRDFVCSFCSKSFKHKINIVTHTKNCRLLQKYSGIVKSCCVAMNKIDLKCNAFQSLDHVICSKDRVLRYKKNEDFYLIYSHKRARKYVETSDSSDEDFNVSKKKHKRRRLLSKSSTETLVIDQNTTQKSLVNSDNDENVQVEEHSTEKAMNNIDLVSIDDSDSASSTSIKAPNKDIDRNNEDNSFVHDKVLQNIITMCHNKYLKRCEIDSTNTRVIEDSILIRKVLSMGGKVIRGKGVNSTGLLRYMEKKALEINWQGRQPRNANSDPAMVRITLKDNKKEFPKISWISLNNIDPDYKEKDFVDIFEDILNTKEKPIRNVSESSYGHKIVSKENINVVDKCISTNVDNTLKTGLNISVDNNTLGTTNPTSMNSPNEVERNLQNSVLFIRTNPESKILNANPVANPKQLPSKKLSAPELFSTMLNSQKHPSKSPSSNMTSNTKDNNVSNSKDQLSMPIITSTVSLAPAFEGVSKVDISTKNAKALNAETEITQSQTLPRIKVKPVSELMPDKGKNQGVNPTTSWSLLDQDNFENVMFKNRENFVKLSNPNNLFNINTPISSTASVSRRPNNFQSVTMHTVELPNSKTYSPFRYFQELLQTHNIVLLDSTETVSTVMTCLIKFKLMFQQESIAPLTLCLSLFCKKNTFCIRVKDVKLKHIDIAEISANWQWEILKEFKGHVAQKLCENAQKVSQEVLTNTKLFIMLLKTIEFHKNDN